MRRGISPLLAVLLSVQLCGLVVGQGSLSGRARSTWRTKLRMVPVQSRLITRGPPGVPAARADRPSVAPGRPGPRPEPTARPPIRGIYTTAYSAGSAGKFAAIVSFIRRTEINAMVIDVKDDSGTISYPSRVPLAAAIGAGRNKYDADKVMAVLNHENIYPIARIVVFQDPYLAAKRPDLAVKSKAGGLWRDFRGKLWVDPHNREVWEYVVGLAKEAAAKGFREVQFDYVRFTSDGKLADCLYPYADGRSKSEVIRDFLTYARGELKSLGVELSADVFGLTCSCRDDLGIGQRIEEIAAAVDIISPMVYPSHYYAGSYGLADPDAAPYETIRASLRQAMSRLSGMGVRVRPWLQDFSLRHEYGRAELMAQIKAVYDAGLTEWIFWNPSNDYRPEKYNPE